MPVLALWASERTCVHLFVSGFIFLFYVIKLVRDELPWQLLQWFIVLQAPLTTSCLFPLNMIDDLKKRMFKHSCRMPVCFEILLILLRQSPLLGVEFSSLVSSDLQSLDSQRWLPSGWASFLGVSISKSNHGCCVLAAYTQAHAFMGSGCCWFTKESQSSFFSCRRQINKGESTFSLPHNLSTATANGVTASCLLTLQSICTVQWI